MSKIMLRKDFYKKPYIYSLSKELEKIIGRQAVIEKTLNFKIKSFDKATTEREMLLGQFPRSKNLSDDELVKKAIALLPSFDVLFGGTMNAIIESEEGRENLISTAIETSTIGFCERNGRIKVLDLLREPDGWIVDSYPIVLDRRRLNKRLLLSSKSLLKS